MSNATLKTVFSKLPAKTHCEILSKLSSYVSILNDEASEHQLEFIVTSMDEVSNGSGLQIVSLFMWHDDELPDVLKPLANEILSNLTTTNA